MTDIEMNRCWACIGYLIGITICLLMYVYTTYFHCYQPTMKHTYAEFGFEDDLKYIKLYKDIEIGETVNEVSALFDFVYVLDFKNIAPTSGVTRPLLRYVVLDSNISGWDAIETLTHELLHIQLCVKDENYVEFMTFKVLYESNNPILVLKAKEIAYNQCTLGHRENTAYDCSYYIAKYLNEA